MRPLLGDPTFLQHDDQIGVVNGPETMGNEHGRPIPLLDDAVDVLEQSGFGVRVQRGCLRWSVEDSYRHEDSLLRRRTVTVDPSR